MSIHGAYGYFPRCERGFVRAAILLVVVVAGPRILGANEEAAERFEAHGVVVDRDFPGGAFAAVRAVSETEFELTIRPENVPINNSAWYAFRVTSEEPRTIRVTLRYRNGRHRYPPRVSQDGVGWTRLPAEAVQAEQQAATLQLDVGPEPLWVAAQELLTSCKINAWMAEGAERSFAEKSLIGQSLEGRPIHQLRIGNPEAEDVLFIIGRQHPPEVTGSLGLQHFVDTLAGDSRRAGEFRRRFQTIVIPLVNPDGVERGYWRHNVGGVDLNRDWGPFAQPETQVVRDQLLVFAEPDGPRLHAFLDFHSTHRDVFYIPSDDSGFFSAGLTERWLDAIQTRFPDYPVRSSPFNVRRPLATRWVTRTLNTTAIIYEWGDRTPRETIARVASGAAEELMQLLLEDRESPAPTEQEPETAEVP